jgi:hypothetical protein
MRRAKIEASDALARRSKGVMAMAATGAASEAGGERVTRTHLTDRKTTLSLISWRTKAINENRLL